MRHVFNRVIYNFGHEAQCTFRANEQVINDIDNIFKINERVQAVTRSIFNLILVMNQVRQFFIGQNIFAQLQDILYHLRFFFEELINALLVGCVENGTI